MSSAGPVLDWRLYVSKFMTIDEPIEYRSNTAGLQDIISHLERCSGQFVPPLLERVELQSYAAKIFKQAERFEAWSSLQLIGLLAAYFDGAEAYITNVSVDSVFARQGVGSLLVSKCITEAKKRGCSCLGLHTSEQDTRAVGFYLSLGFVKEEVRSGRLRLKLPL